MRRVPEPYDFCLGSKIRLSVFKCHAFELFPGLMFYILRVDSVGCVVLDSKSDASSRGVVLVTVEASETPKLLK